MDSVRKKKIDRAVIICKRKRRGEYIYECPIYFLEYVKEE
jgi:hypothetical protein